MIESDKQRVLLGREMRAAAIQLNSTTVEANLEGAERPLRAAARDGAELANESSKPRSRVGLLPAPEIAGRFARRLNVLRAMHQFKKHGAVLLQPGHDGASRSGSRITKVATALSISLLCCLFLLRGSASAAPGDLDSSFSGDGFVLGPKLKRHDRADLGNPAPVAVQSDDSVIALSAPGNVVRYTPTGVRDASFGADGAWVSPLGAILNLVVDSQDRVTLVLRGSEPLAGDSRYVARLLPDGDLDTSFGQSGVFDTQTHAPFSQESAIAVAASGEIVIASGSELIELTSDGQPDTTFSGDGRVDVLSGVIDLAMRPDGSALVLRSDRLVQFLADGSLDPGFGSGGISDAICCHQPEYDEATDLALGPDGAAYVQAGQCPPVDRTPDPCSGGLTKYDAAGKLQPSFGVGADVDQTTSSYGLAVDQAGRVLVGSPGIRVTRATADGVRDSTFGGEGTGTAIPRSCVSAAREIALDSQGRIVLGGTACGRWGVFRFVTAPGPPDADADETLDEADRCPLLAGPVADRGCPTYAPRLKLRVIEDGTGLAGTLTARGDCALRAEVRSRQESTRGLIV